MLGLLLAGALAAGGYDPGRLLCDLQDQRITESSGVVTSSSYDDLMFTHNDSGDTARFFELDHTCRTLATFTLPGVQARDWEDISRGPRHTLWLGDIGDNSATRDRGVLVHRVPEPGRLRGTVQLRPVSYRLKYDDGPHDAEALLIHPRTGQLLIVTKGFAGGRVYAASLPLRVGSPNVLHQVGTVGIPEITGGDISPDGSRVVLRNYTAAYEWDVRGDDVVGALHRDPTRIPLPSAPQGEGIGYTRDGRGLILTSEGLDAPVHELLRVAASPQSTPSTRAHASSGRGPGRPRLALIALLAAGVLLAAGLAGLAATRARR